jgi:hypothetical protein
VPPTLPDASGVTELAVPILVSALAIVGATANNTTSGSVLVIVVIALLRKIFLLRYAEPQAKKVIGDTQYAKK